MKTYLCKYYKKKKRFILSFFEKPASSLKMEDIHKLRVNIKKSRAVFHLLYILSPKGFKAFRKDVFDDVFKNSGKIRELQINRNDIKQYNLISSDTLPYIQYSKRKEKKRMKVLKKNIDNFDYNLLYKTDEKIKHLCNKVSRKEIIKKSITFIIGEAQKIKKLKANIDNVYKAHELRKHLKSIDAIASLLFQMKQNKSHEKILTDVKQTGVALGEWHDKEVLIDSLEKFLKKDKKKSSDKLIPLNNLVKRIRSENKQLLKKSIPKINSVVKKLSAKNIG